VAKLWHNVAANFLGQAWIALIGVVFLPVYVRLLGMEAYGLIAVFVSLQALLFVFDIGLSATLNRELARHSHARSESSRTHDLVRTLEWVFWPLCLVAALLVAGASTTIAEHWLQPVAFPRQRVAHAVMLMGLAIATQWPSAFYAGGLNGVERQVVLNATNVVFATLRWVAVIPVLWWIAPTIEVFLYWQVAVAVLQALAMRALLMRALPRRTQAAHFRVAVLHEVRAFALGMFFIAGLSFALMQTDRIVLSKLLSLDQFGRYVLVATVAATLSRVFNPFFSALYPRYSGLVASGDHANLVILYHRSNQLLAVLVAAVASVLAFFAEDVLRLWTHDSQLASTGGPVLVILVVGSALNGLMNLPYALQLAHGWTRLALYQNLIAVFFVVPATWMLANRYGILGAASVWAVLNFCYITMGIPAMHRRLMRNEMKSWYLQDIIPPVVTAIVTAGMARVVFQSITDDLAGLATLASISIVTLAVCAVSTPAARRLPQEVVVMLRARINLKARNG
jgi:O-antigen/teichoic acid export membrane protein